VNYLAKARVLANSVREHTDVTFVLLLNDRFPPWFDADSEPFDVVWHPADLITDDPDAWIYQHNVMELCTAAKGPALEKIFDELSPDLVFYLDPDAWVLDDLRNIDDLLGDDSIGLTPHITRPETSELGVRMTEMSVLKHGIYNLGFLAVRNTPEGRAFSRWWAERLLRHCYIDFQRGVFTDQRWVDIVPAAFDGVRIIKHPGCNVASWNASGRALVKTEDGRYLADGEPLIFYHFSGVGPAGVHRMVRDRLAYDKPGFALIEAEYEALIEAQGQATLAGYPFHYDRYSNGDRVRDEHRKAYRELAEDKRPPGNPFRAGRDTWYDIQTRGPGRRPVPPVRDVRADDLFDTAFYRTQLNERGLDPEEASLEHYRMVGWLQGLEPSAFFDGPHYVAQAEELPAYRTQPVLDVFSPLDHFAQIGLAHGLSPAPLFDGEWYERAHIDVAGAVIDGAFGCAYEHYLKSGSFEGRNPGPDFWERGYRKKNSDVVEAIEAGTIRNGFEHFLRFGRHEGRPAVAIGAPL
jgi:hypothetical protein